MLRSINIHVNKLRSEQNRKNIQIKDKTEIEKMLGLLHNSKITMELLEVFALHSQIDISIMCYTFRGNVYIKALIDTIRQHINKK